MLLAYLDPERFGLWMTISSLIVVLGFLDFGVGNGLVNVVADANGRNDRRLAKQAVTSAVTLLTLIAIGLVVAYLAMRSKVDWQSLLKITDTAVTSEATAAVTVMVLCLALNLPLQVAQKVQMAYQDGFQANLWQFVGAGCTLGALLIALYFRCSLQWLIFTVAATPVIVAAINWLHQFCKVRLWLRPDRAALDWKMSRHLIGMGSIWTWSQLVGFFGTSADNLIITAYLGPSAVGPYAVMAKLQSALMIAQLLAVPLWPAFAEAMQRGDLTWARSAFRNAIVLFTGIGLVSAFVLGVGSFYIIPVWIGPQMLPTVGMAAGFAAWAVITNLFSAISALMANQRSLKQLTLLTTIAATIAIIIKLSLIEFGGPTAVIWGSVIGYGAICIPALIITRKLLSATQHNGTQ